MTISEHVSLGILRLDYDYPAAPGDIDCPDTFDYDVYYRVVPGLTFEMCQSGELTEEVRENLITAVMWLNDKKVSGITGDCGFMIHIQNIVRAHTTKPVFMSALLQLPTIIQAYAPHEQIAIFTANGESLTKMWKLIHDLSNVDVHDERLVVVGCENVDGFEAVALGQKVDTHYVQPHIVSKALETLEAHPRVQCILMECTELPPYSDAVRKHTRLPVFDSITCADFFMSSMKDNPRFGLNDWQKEWDQEQDSYKYGANLTEEERVSLVNKADDDHEEEAAPSFFQKYFCGF